MLSESGPDSNNVSALLSDRLRAHGFDAHVTDDGDLEVGPRNRGSGAPRATVHLGELLSDYLASLSSGGGVRGEVGADQAVGRLLTQLIESFDAVHDLDDNNLTSRVFLRRSSAGHVVLEERRVQAGGSQDREGGPFEWMADRP